MRLDKYLVECGICSRKEAKSMIKAGRVAVDGITAGAGEDKLDPETAHVCVDGRELEYERYHYYMLNKPVGYITATEDGRQQTVLDLFPEEIQRQGIFPVGRLDKDTTGLLILTTDGEYAHKVISPTKHVPKLYEAVLNEPITEQDVLLFKKGIELSGNIQCLPAELYAVDGDMCTVRVTIFEGKYHQVKRMFAHCGKNVLQLKRLSIGALELDAKLLPGCYRKMTENEKNQAFFTKK